MKKFEPLSNYISWRRLKALCYKEALQIFRDPSSNIMAFVLPVVLLLIFGLAINLDSSSIKVGLLMEDTSRPARQFADSLYGSPFLEMVNYNSRQEMENELTRSHIRGFVAIQSDFSQKLQNSSGTAAIQVVTDGTQPNIAEFVQAYVNGAWLGWQAKRASDHGHPLVDQIDVEPRYWFNPSAESRNYLIPGSIAIIMTVIGALLTSLVVAREWERGTMEALLASPVTRTELLLSKLIPYYLLGIVSLFICVIVATGLLRVPFRGSFLMLWLVSSFFLISVLGIGLLMSTKTRNQFIAAQAALNIAFLPAMMLSGFIYEIQSMPLPIRLFTYLIPARYFVSSIQTLFQAGDIWSVLGPNLLFLFGASSLFLFLTARATRRHLE